MRPNTKNRHQLKPKTNRRHRRRTQKRMRTQKSKGGGAKGRGVLGFFTSFIKSKPETGSSTPETDLTNSSLDTADDNLDTSAPKLDPVKPEINLYKVINKVDRIGANSANGYIYELSSTEENPQFNTENGLNDEYTFTNNRYNSYVLKIAQDDQADNLFYEYIAGKYINEFANYVPFFTKTYGLFKYKNSIRDLFQGDPSITANTLNKVINKTHLVPGDIPINSSNPYENIEFINEFGDICKGKYCILIEKVENIQDVKQLTDDDSFLLNDLIKIFYQLYVTLDMFKTHFTHYDLHRNNVLICKLPNNQYIEHHYAYANSGDFVKFKCEYYIKIIDYGRCFFESMDGVNTSKKALNVACMLNSCNGNHCGLCGEDCGFFRDDISRNITTTKANNTADLIYIKHWLRKITRPCFDTFKEQFQYARINDVTELHLFLKARVKNIYMGKNKKTQDDYYSDKPMLKTLYIDVDTLQPVMSNFNEISLM